VVTPDRPLFLHREIKLFFKDHIEAEPYFAGKTLMAVIELLQLLDTKGKCSSVVNKHKDEPEMGYEHHVFLVLKKITLNEHTMNVAREIIKLSDSDTPVIAKNVIAALAHDLEKISHYYDKLNATVPIFLVFFTCCTETG
jgi:hypothetical protein